MICAACGTPNNVGAKFCQECATPLAVTCPNCGAAASPGAKFCSECATPLSLGASVQVSAPNSATAARTRAAATAQQPDSEPVAERRLVTVMFADLVGFTPFAEERDSEDVRETLTKYFDVATDVIGRYGGTIEKFIGDAVMAVWGAPTTHEDDPERAVRAALELVDAVPSLGDGIQARAGVLTGEAAVTLAAANQGMVAGDIVNTASRLQSAARPGTVLVGEATHRAASAAIAFEPAGEQMLKGKQAPVAAWRAIRVVAERGGRNRSEALEAPFVGRQEEMRLLKDLFHTTGREKRLRVMSMIGPGGIGKSRLAREFLKYIDGLVEVVFWHSGRSPAYGEGITFWALGEMVRERCGLREGDDEQTTREKVAETVAGIAHDADERSWIENALLTLLGIGSGLGADQLFGAWRTFFERLAEQGTVVLVFEDMHFADTGLLDFVDHLLQWSRGLPLYVVTLARPDLIERRPDWGAGKRNFFSMYLEPLPPEQMRQLLAGLVPGLPESAVATIVARADGIPLYAVETVRTLVAEHRLVESDGVYVPQGDLTSLSIPDTLTALIASRLDSLDDTDRRIVHDAAVLGQSFSLGSVAAVSGVAEAELQPRLEQLVRRELLVREMDARSPERGQYSFVQALIREVAYNTLSKRDRRKLHLAAARHFETLGNDEIAGVLASHYFAAYQNAAEGPETEALAGQARIALRAAATRARSLGAPDQATAFYEQALTVTTDKLEQVELLSSAGQASITAGREERAEMFARKALDAANETGERPVIARATADVGFVLAQVMHASEGAQLLEPAITEFADVDESILARMKLSFARLQLSLGDIKRALGLLDEVLETAERRGDIETVVLGLVARGNALSRLGRRREYLGITTLARDLARENGLTDPMLRAMGNLGMSMTDIDFVATIDAYRETIEAARKAGHRASLLNTVANFGYAAFLAGEWDTGLELAATYLDDDVGPRDRLVILNNVLVIRAARGENIRDGIDEMERLGKAMSGNWRVFVADPKAAAAMAAGDVKTARDAYMEIADADLGQAAEYLYRAARSALWAGDVDDAKALLGRLSETGADGPTIDARRKTMTAGVAAAEGRTAEALTLYRDALGSWRSVHGVFDEAMTGLDMAELLDPAEPDVASAVRTSRSIFERLRAAPYLARLEAAASPRVTAPARRPSQRVEVGLTE